MESAHTRCLCGRASCGALLRARAVPACHRCALVVSSPRSVRAAVVALAPNVGSALKRSWQGAGGTILGSALGIAVMAIMERIIGSSAFNQHPVASVRTSTWVPSGTAEKATKPAGRACLWCHESSLLTWAEEARARPAGGVGDRVPVAGGRPADAAQGAPRPEAALRHGRGAAHVRRRGCARCGQRLTSTLGVGACAQRAVLPDATTPKCA